MNGNAGEWVHDHFTPEEYGSSSLSDPDGTLAPEVQRVFRVGLFNSWSTLCRSAAHLSDTWGSPQRDEAPR